MNDPQEMARRGDLPTLPMTPDHGTRRPPLDADPAGSVVAGYMIERELGRGGMGVVYLARQTALNRTVALKMILAGEHAGAHHLGRFRTEVETIARLRHPNIVQIYEVGGHGGLPFYSLEYCAGGSLDERLNGTPLVPAEAAALVETLARAIDFAHRSGVIHRDLKPANILLQHRSEPPAEAEPGFRLADFETKVSDFGLAKQLDRTADTSGTVLGTPSYMSPEQASGASKEAGPSCDVYALGAVLYECLTGRPPFNAATAMETLIQVTADEPVPPRVLNPQVPRDVEVICLHCLHKDPARRYASAGALADDLARWCRREPIAARPAGVGERAAKWARRRPALAALIVVSVLALAALAALDLSGGRRIRAERDVALRARADAEHESRVARAEHARAEEQRRAADRERDRAERLAYAGQLALAQAAWQDSPGVAWQHLNTCPLALRGWEHRLLATHFARGQHALRGHTDRVRAVAFSPDGKTLASAGSDRTIRLWDLASGDTVLTLKGHTGAVVGLAYSLDGKVLASAGEDETVRLWDAASGAELRTLKGHAGPVLGVAFRPDGAQLASAGWDQTVRLWDAVSGAELRTLKGHPNPVWSVAYSPDGKHLVSGGGGLDERGKRSQGVVKVWQAATGEAVGSLEGHGEPVLGVAFSPDGLHIATASWDFTVRTWDADGGVLVQSLKGHTKEVQAVAYSPDGQRLVSASTDQTVRVWDDSTGQELFALRGHRGVVSALAFSPDGRYIAGGGEDQTVHIWDADKGQEYTVCKGRHTKAIFSVAFSPDGTRLASAGEDETVKVWGAADGREVRTLNRHADPVRTVAWSPDGKRLASASYDKTVKLWDAGSGEALRILRGHTGRVYGVAFHPDGTRLASGSGDGTVRIWDTAEGQELVLLKGHTDTVSAVAYSPDGTRLASAGYDKMVRIWDVAGGTEPLCLKGHGDWVNGVAFSPDGRRLASVGHDRTLRVWDAADGAELLRVEGHTAQVNGVTYSPDGKRILTAGHDRTVRVWDAETGQELLALAGHTDCVWAVAFSPDGKRAASAGGDLLVRMWEADRADGDYLLRGHVAPVARVAFDRGGERVFAWDERGRVLAWSVATGGRADASDAPAKGEAGPVRSPDGQFRAESRGSDVVLTDLRVADPKTKDWDWPGAAERQRYHTDQVARAEKEGHWFAAAFHLGRLLLDDPDNADLKQRRDDALKKHANAKP